MRGALCARKAGRERCPLAWQALNGNVAMMISSDHQGNVKTQAAAFDLGIDAVESAKDLVQFIDGDARAFVLYGHKDALVSLLDLYSDPAIFRREFHGIVDQIQEKALEVQRIGLDGDCFCAGFEIDRQILRSFKHPGLGHELMEQPHEVNALHVKGVRLIIYPGQQQQVFDDLEHFLAFFQCDLDRPLIFLCATLF